MSIKDLIEKVNPARKLPVEGSVSITLGQFFSNWVRPFYFLFLILVIAGIFFALGRLSALEEQNIPIRIEYPIAGETASVISTSTQAPFVEVGGGEVIGSKNGKKYYFPWCGTVKMIKPENQIKFTSAEEAKLAGYTPALNCKGLK